MQIDPLLRSAGTSLDPALLFGDDELAGKTRISLINFIGLPGLESQRHFLNQLTLTLFSWIKQNPDPGERKLRGLLVIDEAKDFVPSSKASVRKESLMRLVAQARKYHLGAAGAEVDPQWLAEDGDRPQSSQLRADRRMRAALRGKTPR
jgi:hypothetical protein